MGTTFTETGMIVLALALLSAAVSVPSILRSFRRVVTLESPLPLGSVMWRRGIAPDDATGREYELVMAASRCGSCMNVEKCRAWLALECRDGIEAFCPNAPFLSELKKQA